MDDIGFDVSKMWHEILMNSSTAEDVQKYPELMRCSPVELRILLLAGGTPKLLLRDYTAMLHIPKSTLTSIINRLEKQGLLARVISDRDRRSYCLEPSKQGQALTRKYMEYQHDIGARIIGGLNSDERDTLVLLLRKISSHMIRGKIHEESAR